MAICAAFIIAIFKTSETMLVEPAQYSGNSRTGKSVVGSSADEHEKLHPFGHQVNVMRFQSVIVIFHILMRFHKNTSFDFVDTSERASEEMTRRQDLQISDHLPLFHELVTVSRCLHFSCFLVLLNSSLSSFCGTTKWVLNGFMFQLLFFNGYF